MATRHHEFGAAQVRPQALGKPGQRTFCLALKSPAGSATLWLEKQQLSELALAIQRVLSGNDAAPSGGQLPEASVGNAKVEFKVGRIGLDFDAGRQGVFMLLEDLSDNDTSTIKLSCWLSRQEADEFSESALAVCSAGRPLCPLCHSPVDPEGHRCAKSNGHRVGVLEDGQQQA